MEVQFVPKTSLPSNAQSTSHVVPATSGDSSAASKPILARPAQAVSATARIAASDAERRQDRISNQGDGPVSPQKVLDSLRLTNRRTQLDFDRELDKVVLQIIDTRTEEVIETIPSEQLIRQLQRLAGPQQHHDTANGGGAVLDQSI
jgi:uncharacterized FlaG/YvyC family protein